MRVNSDGRVTIPAPIRKQMGWLPGTEVEFALVGGQVVLRKTLHLKGRGREVIEALRGKGTVRMTTDQIMALTRGWPRRCSGATRRPRR